MITTSCPQCGHSIRVADEHAGKRGSCKKCGEKIRIPIAKNELVKPPERVPVIVERIPEPVPVPAPVVAQQPQPAPQAPPPAPVHVHVQNVNTVNVNQSSNRYNNRLARWSAWFALIALVLSFCSPVDATFVLATWGVAGIAILLSFVAWLLSLFNWFSGFFLSSFSCTLSIISVILSIALAPPL